MAPTVVDALVRLPTGLAQWVSARFPGSAVVDAQPLLPDSGHGADAKVAGYGRPFRIALRSPEGRARNLVFRTATPNEFGHDRRSDRADAALLAYDTSRSIPRTVEVLDVGALGLNGELVSLEASGEFYLVTEFAEGAPYAEDLRRIARDGISPADEARCEALAGYLVELHAEKPRDDVAYRRTVRDLVGHGEGIFGVVDGYPSETPGAPPERLARIERLCLAWRWKLRGKTGRLSRTHGDFHPFNILFRDGTDFALLDASRGCRGDPADDVTALAVNYVFFAIDEPGAWTRGLRALWRRFWETYLSRGDTELLTVVAPFLTWRFLVVACPKFYPGLSEAGRGKLLRFSEKTLEAERFDPESADSLFP